MCAIRRCAFRRMRRRPVAVASHALAVADDLRASSPFSREHFDIGWPAVPGECRALRGPSRRRSAWRPSSRAPRAARMMPRSSRYLGRRRRRRDIADPMVSRASHSTLPHGWVSSSMQRCRGERRPHPAFPGTYGTFLPRLISPCEVEGPSAMTSPSFTRSPTLTIGRWLKQVPWLLRENLMSM